MTAANKVLIVLTSHDRLGDTGLKTGFWLEELAAPYYVFRDAGVEMQLASPKGGQPPLDPKSNLEDHQTDATRRFQADAAAQAQLANTARITDVDAGDYDAVFYPGGHGPLWDLVDDADSIRLIEAFWNDEKPVATVCHSPIVLIHAKREDGEPLVQDLEVTGFTNSEEDAVELIDVVPFLVEDELIARGGHYAKTDDWVPFTKKAGLLITGQNPASSAPVAELVLKTLAASE